MGVLPVLPLYLFLPLPPAVPSCRYHHCLHAPPFLQYQSLPGRFYLGAFCLRYPGLQVQVPIVDTVAAPLLPFGVQVPRDLLLITTRSTACRVRACRNCHRYLPFTGFLPFVLPALPAVSQSMQTSTKVISGRLWNSFHSFIRRFWSVPGLGWRSGGYHVQPPGPGISTIPAILPFWVTALLFLMCLPVDFTLPLGTATISRFIPGVYHLPAGSGMEFWSYLGGCR